MKILALSDEESPYLWDYFERSKFDGINLIISCGDLDADYLSFLTTLTSIPVLYVPGNHDERYLTHPPEGCICIDGQVYVHNGVRIMGLGGSLKYRPGEYQYTEGQMRIRAAKAALRALPYGGIDILVTHAPAYGLNDGEDFPHRGFQIFRWFLDKWKPKYYLHGHVHLNYSSKQKRLDHYQDTVVINAFERYIFDY